MLYYCLGRSLGLKFMDHKDVLNYFNLNSNYYVLRASLLLVLG